jgi:hypothetical protein
MRRKDQAKRFFSMPSPRAELLLIACGLDVAAIVVGQDHD